MISRNALRWVAAAIIASSTSALARGDMVMQVGAVTSHPIGHFELCKIARNECGPTVDKGPTEMSNALWSEVRRVQREVNEQLEPMLDMEAHGRPEVWSFPEKAGDCEDYALIKRRRIHEELGIPLSNLLMTVVRKADGEGHAVLTLRTKEGDFILDNLKDGIPRWDRIRSYSYLKRQSSSHAGRWVEILPAPDMTSTSGVSEKDSLGR